MAPAGRALAPCGQDSSHSLGETWTCSDGCSTCSCDSFGAITSTDPHGACGLSKPVYVTSAEGGSEAVIVQGAMLIVFALFAAFVLMLCYMCNKPQNIEHATIDDDESASELSPVPRPKMRPVKGGGGGKAAKAARAGWGDEPPARGGKSSKGGKKSRK